MASSACSCSPRCSSGQSRALAFEASAAGARPAPACAAVRLLERAAPPSPPTPPHPAVGGPLEPGQRRPMHVLLRLEVSAWIALLGFTVFATYVLASPAIDPSCWCLGAWVARGAGSGAAAGLLAMRQLVPPTHPHHHTHPQGGQPLCDPAVPNGLAARRLPGVWTGRRGPAHSCLPGALAASGAGTGAGMGADALLRSVGTSPPPPLP